MEAEPPIFRLCSDVIDEIFGRLNHREDIATLKACSLACKLLRPSSQRLIHSRIVLYSNNNHVAGLRQKRIALLLDILQNSPSIGKYVRELDLRMDTSDNEWVAQDRSFLNLMKYITSPNNNLQELYITGTSFPDQFADARSLEKNFLEPFINPVICKLHISGMVNIPVSILSSSVNLKDLTLRLTDLEKYDFSSLKLNSSPVNSQSPRLSTLQFNRPEGATTTLLESAEAGYPIANLSSLKLIVALGGKSHLEYIQRIIVLASNSLEEICIITKGSEPCFEGALDLAPLTCFHTFDVSIPFPGGLAAKDSLENLCNTLRTIPSSTNNYHTLYLTTYVGLYSYDKPEHILTADWAALDMEITRISTSDHNHKRQRKFTLNLDIVYDGPDSDDSNSEEEGEDRLIEQCESVFRALAKEKLPRSYSAEDVIIRTRYSLQGWVGWTTLETL